MTFETKFAAARRKYIASNFPNLNDMQRQAVLTTQGPLLLLAGAGSGKTTVLIHRIANLIRYGCGSDSPEVPEGVTQADLDFLENLPENPDPAQRERADRLCALHPAAPWSVLAITFTNKAAGELKTRLEAAIGPQALDVWAMTFHSACCRILRREIDRLGYDRSFTIYDTADSERIGKEIIKSMHLEEKSFPVKSVLNRISRAKDQLQTPEAFAQMAQSAGDDRLVQIARVYAEYQRRLKANNAVDFDDIIYLTVELLEQFPEVRAYYQRKFRYVLIDEYQDTNRLQYRLAAALAGGYENICVVGDDDQSIYRFRGATIENILHFEQDYPGAKTIRLEQNYRSTQSILNAANGVIAHNQGRKGKTLWTANDPGQPVLIYEAATAEEEANFVAGQILASRRSFQDFAILYRTNVQSNALEYAFKRNGIPYRVIGGVRYFDRAEVKDMLAYLCLINNRADDLRLQRIVNNPPRGLGGKTMETIQRLAQAQGCHLYQVMQDPTSYAPLERSVAKIQAFTGLIEDLAGLLAAGMPLDEFYDQLVLRTGYGKMLSDKPTEENITRLENVRELKSSILSYMHNADSPTLAGFLEEIALYTDIEQYDASADAVVMMTMHSAKGLEFPQVFLVGAEEGLFPGIRAIGDPEEMEEERRLCYVAITRARERLVISYARQRMLYGRTSACSPSRFLQEIPQDCVERRGGFRRPTPAKPRPAPRRAEHSDLVQANAPAPVNFSPGDTVQHTAFGKGLVTSVRQMGGDALLEIAFDDVGTKRLMAKYAAAYLTKR